ncbi:PAS domain S-box protein [uncultured Draconibacterium sp.]|uniref:PAS domain S-box protein n=1 Tax=uncultured Draconibacterium sp. TaxID=1573823 RepID=UPI0029C6BE6C|nr:PAS domain S-box protein [uncultured Draconibacterium sp.]
MKTKILDLIDFEKVDILLEGFNKSTGFVTAILDLDGNILSKSGWRQACTAFHRVNPETSKKCTISDTTLANKMGKNESYHFYQCLNGLVDVSVPIVIGNEHIANLFSGQFFFEEPDREYFKKQAQKYGFDEENYLKSIREVPVLSKDKVISAMDFLLNMTQMISEISFQKLEQMQLNEAVKRSERTLRLFVEYSPASIAMFDNNMCYLIASRRFLTDYNLGDRNIVGLSHYEVFPEIPERWKEIHQRALKGEIISADNDPFPRINGEMDWIRWEIRPWFRSHMEIGGIILFSEVITEYKKSEQALIDSQAYNRTLFEQSVIGLALTEMDGKLVDINPAYATIIGRTVEETKQLTYWDITPEKYNLKEQEQLKLLEKTGRYGPYEKEYIHKNGNLVPVRLQGQIIERAGEKYIWSSVEDISEQKQAEEELKLSEKKYRYLFNNNPLPMWIYNLETLSFMEVNEAAILHYGYSEAEFKAMTLCDIRPNEDVHLLLEDVAGTFESYNKAGIWKHKKKNGEIIFVEIVSHLIDFENIPARLVQANDVTNRRKAEEALKESEKQYRSLFENMNAGFVLFEVCQNKQGIPVDLIIAAANEGFEETTGLKLRNAIGSKLTEVLPGIEKDDADWIGTYSKVAVTGEAIQFEQGSELLGYYYSVSAFKAGPKQCAVTFVDITERKLAEELNRKSAKRAKMQRNLIARLTFEESVFNRDVDDALKIITSKLAQIMQVDRVSVWLLSDDNTKLQRRMLYDTVSGSDSQIEVLNTADIPSYFAALRKDSQIDAEDAQNDTRTRELNENYFIPLQITSLLDSAIQQDGQLIGVLSAEHRGPIRKWQTDEKSFFSAITNLVAQLFSDVERKKAEAELKRMTRIMKNAQEIAHLGSFEYVAADQTTIWSEEEYRIYGLDPTRPSPEYNVMLEKCIHPDDKKLLHAMFMAAMQNQAVYELEHRIVRPDGSVRWVYDKAHPYFDKNGILLRYVGATLDITDRKNLQEELEILNAELEKKVEQRTSQLEAANKELETFTYSVSHDLKAPLRGIDGYSKLLLNEYGNSLNEEASHFIKTIRSSTLQMNQLIEDLLAYSRLERSHFKPERIALQSFIKTLVSDFSNEIENEGIIVEIEIPEVEIVTDSTGLSIVLRNLLENAIKFTRGKPAPKVEINWEKKNGFWIISVKDNGVGFDMKYHNRIFEIFQRLHRSEDFQGTGIGLAMVFKAVQRMNGKVWAESSLGVGATFFVELPN